MRGKTEPYNTKKLEYCRNTSMQPNDFTKFYNKKLTLFESYLQKHIPKLPEQVDRLKNSMQYSLMAGGKRLRPILLITAYECFKKDSLPVYPFACALEYIHTYSLIHDDLPCMDNDDLRRGKPTNHIKFGEDTALLAGDGLLTHAFYLVSRNEYRHLFSADAILEAVQVLSSSAGLFGMVSGQAADIYPPKEIPPEEIIQFIHSHKTGALITAALQMGAILGEATSTDKEALILFGKEIGKCFQIQDDILDEIGEEEKIGKPVGSDRENEKLTYPSIFGMEKAQKLADLSYQSAIENLKKISRNTSQLEMLANFILKRDH